MAGSLAGPPRLPARAAVGPDVRRRHGLLVALKQVWLPAALRSAITPTGSWRPDLGRRNKPLSAVPVENGFLDQ